jgi:hypothetical protein
MKHRILSILRGLTVFCALSLLTGCATLTKVIKTVDDIADAACAIFGTEHPDEFIELVTRVKPDLAPKLDKASLDVGKLCDLKEVVQPFLDDQRMLQTKTAVSLRASMSAGGESAASPQ